MRGFVVATDDEKLDPVLGQARQRHDIDKSVIGRSLRILEAISRVGRPLSLAVLAEVTNLPKSTAFRVAGQLVDVGVLERRGGIAEELLLASQTAERRGLR
jgi:hypothetical protein